MVALLIWRAAHVSMQARRIPKANLVSPDARLMRGRQQIRSGATYGDSFAMSIVDRLSRLFNKTPVPPVPEDHRLPSPIPAIAVDYEDERVPSGAQDRIRRILASLEGVQVAMSREEIPSFNRVDIEQMRDLHLPKLVKSYIDIPAAHRSEIFRRTGKSASFKLNESLDQMQSKIDDILRNLAQHDIDAFTNNIKFIGQKYADDDDPFK